MNLATYLNRVPRLVLVPIVPLIVFMVSFGVSLGTNGSDETAVAPSPTQNLGALAELSTPTKVPTVAPTATAIATATAVPDRDDCGEIQGTQYRSESEREWYLANCTGTAVASEADTADYEEPVYQEPVYQEPVYETTGPAVTGAGEYGIGDRLIIPAIGVDTVVNGVTVGSDGAMPDPVGYFNAVWYDFQNHPGLGGYVGGGNTVLAGHVDCAACHNGASGAAVFYYVSSLAPGDSIQYITSGGEVHNYVVTFAGDYTSDSPWSTILSSGAADMTLVTCNGTFNTAIHEYSHRRVIYASEV